MPGSAAEDYEATAPGAKKFTAASAVHVEDLSEEIQIEAGVLNGLGSKDYEMVEVVPGDQAYWGFPDRRSMRTKFGRLYRKEDPFPRERYQGQGFDRQEEVDLARVAGHTD